MLRGVRGADRAPRVAQGRDVSSRPRAPGREVSLGFPRPRGELGKKTAISSPCSAVYVTEVKFMWLDPCFLGKSACLVITLSCGTGTHVEG